MLTPVKLWLRSAYIMKQTFLCVPKIVLCVPKAIISIINQLPSSFLCNTHINAAPVITPYNNAPIKNARIEI